MNGYKVIGIFFVILFVVGCSDSKVEVSETQSYIKWFYDENKIEFNLYITNEQSTNEKFYLYLVNTDNELANALDYRIAPFNDGEVFNIEAGQELLVTDTINLPTDVFITEQILSNAFEVIVESAEDASNKSQSQFKISEINIVQID